MVYSMLLDQVSATNAFALPFHESIVRRCTNAAFGTAAKPTAGFDFPAMGSKPAVLSGLSAGRRGDNAMARTYREIAIEEMLRTVEEAMSQVINWWGDLPPPMKEAIEQFRTQLGAAIDSVEFVKRALDREVHETDRGKGPP